MQNHIGKVLVKCNLTTDVYASLTTDLPKLTATFLRHTFFLTIMLVASRIFCCMNLSFMIASNRLGQE